MLHKFELAQTYYERGEGDDNILCKVWCKKVIEMVAVDSDDSLTLEKARNLLAKVERTFIELPVWRLLRVLG